MAEQRRDKGSGAVYFEHKAGTTHNPNGQRGDGDNTKFHRGCTGRWRGTVDFGRRPNGKRDRRPVTGSTKQEVLDKMTALREEAASGVEIDKKITVAQALDALIAFKREDGAAPKTVSADMCDANLLKAEIGGVKLHELTVQDFKAVLQRLAKNTTTGHVRKIKGVMAQAIRLVQQDDKLERNVAEIATAPRGKKPSRKRKAHSAEEVRKILAASVGVRNMDFAIHLGFGLGPRPEEILGLHWAEVDLTPGNEAVYFTKTTRHTGATKGETDTSLGSRRGGALPPEVALAMRRHRTLQNAERLRAGKQWQDNDLVFTTRTGGPLAQGNFRRSYRAVLAAAGIEDSEHRVPYDMRHTFASHATEVESRDRVAEMMGHKRVATLELVYKDVIKPVIRETRNLGLYRSSDTG